MSELGATIRIPRCLGDMRAVCVVLVLTAGVAAAESSWSEFGRTERLRPATQLTEASCQVEVQLRGAIADVELHQHLTNPGHTALAATTELVLPAGAQLIGLALQPKRNGKAERAVVVPVPLTNDRISSDRVLGADPAIITALPTLAGRPRYRVIVQPIEPDQEVVVVTRWIATADIRDGALKLVLPGRTSPCRGTIHATPGPGTTVQRIRVDGQEVGARGAPFELTATDLAIDVELAFARAEPVVWTQTESLGDGWTARAITIATPAVRTIANRRALFVIDGSRSMELVGRHNVKRIVHEIGNALPKGTELDAIIYDRKPVRVLGAWKPAEPQHVATIETALANHTAGNGSDAAAALALARKLIGDAMRGQTMIILITDGVLGEGPSSALTQALAAKAKDLDVHAIVLSPGRLQSPDTDAIRAPVDLYGGSYVEVPVAELDSALTGSAAWLRPAWLGLAITGTTTAMPDQLRAGTGVVLMDVVRKPGKISLSGHATAKVSIAGKAAPAASFAQLALALAGHAELTEPILAQLRLRHPAVDDQRALVVLATAGKVAKSRYAVVAGGGPFTRMVAVDDPAFPVDVRIGTTTVTGGNAIDRNALTLLFRTQLQPAAFACYQRALGRAPNLAGTVQFRIEIGRGELTRATLTGLADATFDACLLDAAYLITPPLPNPDYNNDDRTVANYPLSFTVREDKPFVIPGDADSSSPIDISSIKGGPPHVRGRVKAGDTSTPLGNLRPTSP